MGGDCRTRPLDFFKLNCFLRKNNVFKGLKKLQEAYNYFLYKQIVNIVLKKFESIEKLKKREEPAVSKLGSQRYENTPSVFFLKNNIFFG